ncbi:MAG: GntR family transcriptional regulator [bacterium]
MRISLKAYKPLREEIADRLRELIVKGELSPGARLIEPDLAAKIGVSRTPVREAFLQLESEGFVTVVPRKGAIVAPYSKKDAQEIYEVLMELESLAGRLALEKMSDGAFAKLDRLADKCDSAQDRSAQMNANFDFHTFYVKMCDNEILTLLIENLYHKLNRYRSLVFTAPGRVDQGNQEHHAIIEAFARRDPTDVSRLIREHLDNSRISLLTEMQKQPQRLHPKSSPKTSKERS